MLRLFNAFMARYWLRHPGRAVPAVLAIAAGTAVMVAIRAANMSVLEAFRAATDAVHGQADLRIYGTGGPILESQLSELLWLERWAVMSPVMETYAMVVHPSDDQFRTNDTLLHRNEVLMILGVDVLVDEQIRSYHVWRRRGEQPMTLTPRQLLDVLLEPDGIVLTERFARRYGIDVHQTIRLAFGSRVCQLKVRALLEDVGPARTLQGNFGLMDIAALQQVTERYGVVDYVDLRVRENLSVEEALRAIQRKLPHGLLVEPPATRIGRSETMVRAFQFNLTALSMVALIVGLFLVYATVAFSVTIRQEEIAILLALGAPRRWIVGLFLGEAIVMASVGALLGLPAGQWMARGAVRAVSQTVETFYIGAVAEATATHAVLSWREWQVAGVLVVGTAVLAAWLPAWRAAGLDPLVVLRQATPQTAPLRIRRIVAQCAWWALVGGLAVVMPPVSGLPVFGFVAALCWCAAVAGTTPLWMGGVSRAAWRWFPQEWVAWRLALAQLAAGGSSLATAVAALGFSLGMMFSIAIMVSSFRTTVVYWLDNVLTSDLVVKPVMNSPTLSSATLDPQLVEELRSQPEVLASAWYSSRQVPYGSGMIRLDTSELAVLIQHGRIRFKEPTSPQQNLAAAVARRDRVACVSESFSLRYRRHPGDMITLDTPSGPAHLRVIAVYYDYSSNLGTILIDYAVYQQLFQDPHPLRSPMALSFYFKPGVDVQEVRRRWATSYAEKQALYFVTNQEVRADALRIFDSTFAITYVLQVIAVILATAGIAAALLRVLHLRRQEIGLLKLLGMEPAHLAYMIVCEAVLVGFISQWVGWWSGMILSLVLIFVINVQSFGWTIQWYFPATFFCQATVVIVVACVASAWLPARWTVSLDAIAAVREE